ncbi:actin [Plasmodium falciparum RAJ116]|uniref:Actin n=1 Tax=Plasmodium falciparum RAJ116 TaxID=580058 RepID=A0A0L0CYV1_PLAFA|nr:actin [Plasmodium falciparum RAJ116]
MENKTIVIDNGSGYIKAGINSSEEPTIVFPTIVGIEKNDETKRIYTGDEAFFHESNLNIYRPIDHGHISDWDKAQKVWDYTLNCVDPSKSIKDILLTEPPLCSISHRKKMREIFFEYFDTLNLNLSFSGLINRRKGLLNAYQFFEGILKKTLLFRSDFDYGKNIKKPMVFGSLTPSEDQ